MAEKPDSVSKRRRKGELERLRKLTLRMLDWYRNDFEQYVRIYRIVHGYDPDTDDVSNTWPEDVVEEIIFDDR